MGLWSWSLGDSARALAHHRDALTHRRASDDRQGTPQTLNNIGWAYLTLGQQAEARSHFDQALAASRVFSNPRHESLALNNLGLTAFYTGDYAPALRPSRGIAAAAPGRRRSARRGAESAQSGAHARRARQPHGRRRTLPAGARTLQIDRRSQQRSQHPARARRARRRSRRSADRPGRWPTRRSRSPNRCGRTSPARICAARYLAARQNYYELYIDVLMRLHRQEPGAGYDGQALHVSERARARSMLEMLAEARAGITRGVDPALLERERAARRRLDARERSRIELLNRTHTPAQAAAAERELESRLQEYRDVRTQVRISSPRYAAMTQPQPSHGRRDSGPSARRSIRPARGTASERSAAICGRSPRRRSAATRFPGGRRSSAPRADSTTC